MVAGERPFARQTARQAMVATLEARPSELPGVPEELNGVVARCLEKNPQERFQAAQDLAFALRAARGRPGRVSRRWRMAAAAAALAAAGEP